MIFEPDIIEHEDCVGCRPSFGKGWYWQIQKRGFIPGHEELYNASTTRQVINRQTLMEFSWHRRPITVLGVSLDGKTLQSFVEHLDGNDIDVRAVATTDDMSGMLLVRQGAGMGVIFEVTFSESDVPDRYTLQFPDYDNEDERPNFTIYKALIADATNRAGFAHWAHAMCDWAPITIEDACKRYPCALATRIAFTVAEFGSQPDALAACISEELDPPPPGNWE